MRIITGGAKGVDEHVEWLCNQYGHTCAVLIPPCHPRAKHDLVPLTMEQLNEGMQELQTAASVLQRTVTSPVSQQYLARNYHIVKNASCVLAFGFFDVYGKHVLGGTGWGVQLAKQMNKQFYVFDALFGDWHYWDPHQRLFFQCEGMHEHPIPEPRLTNDVAIIGSRDMDSSMYHALEKLFLDDHEQSRKTSSSVTQTP